MAGRVEGKVALVTGVARGQGRSHAVRLAAEGADVIAVVANAGIGSTGVKLHPIAEPLWQATIDVNLSGVWKTVKAGVPHLLGGGRGGSIILTSSVVGLKTYPQVGHYVAAKHGVVGLMRTFAVVLGSTRSGPTWRTRVPTTSPRSVGASTCCRFRGGRHPTSAVRCCSLRPTKPATSPEYPCPSTRAFT
jgi:NAD(P)-dependent dehydrogenase (short-subunit alcohol dehydrogenase family)